MISPALPGVIAEGVSWWTAEMRSMVPAGVLVRLSAPRALVVVCVGADGMRAVLHGADGRDLGLFPSDRVGAGELVRALGPLARSVRVALCTSPGETLERDVALPLAAAVDPGGVLRLDMDRLMPFSADGALWGWRIARRDKERKRLHVTLRVCAVADRRDTMRMLGQAGLSVSCLAMGPGDVDPVTLADAPESERGPGIGHRLALAACVLLALGAAGLPWAERARETAAMNVRIAALAPRVEMVHALERKTVEARAQAADADEMGRRQGNPLHALEAVSEALPDGTWLTSLSMSGGKVKMEGRSRASSSLIRRLGAPGVLRDPSFTSAVSKGEGDVETFSVEGGV